MKNSNIKKLWYSRDKACIYYYFVSLINFFSLKINLSGSIIDKIWTCNYVKILNYNICIV